VVIAGSDKATRRRGVRRPRDPDPVPFGPQLRLAREQNDLSLDVIGDRTGVRRRDLEALEEGDLSGFRDERAALMAARRFAETVGLDGIVMSHAVGEQWRSMTGEPPAAVTGPPPRAMTGVVPAIGPEIRTPAPAPVVSRVTSTHPVASPHLRSFTETAQVPQVAGTVRPATPTLPPGLRFDSTDAIPVTSRPTFSDQKPGSLGLRVALWTAVLLILLGVGGLSVDHWRPSWLAKLHLVSGTPAPSRATGTGGRTTTTVAPRVTESASGSRAATVTVHASAYQVVVATQQTCWINVTTPSNATPVFSQTVPSGTTKVFSSVGGQLSVELGASGALVAVRIGGKTAPDFLLAPKAVPYIVSFHSATG
jgi:hypothetical protein